MKINFSKYNGAGNDFILIDDRENLIDDNESLISYLCNRHFGIGGDGLIILKESSNSDFEILHYTSDGNLGSLCGNGSRCAVLFAYNKDIISKNSVFHAFDGIHNAEILDNGLIKMEMKVNSNIESNSYGTWLDTGSPHLVVEKNDTDKLDVNIEGRLIRYNDFYKEACDTRKVIYYGKEQTMLLEQIAEDIIEVIEDHARVGVTRVRGCEGRRVRR